MSHDFFVRMRQQNGVHGEAIVQNALRALREITVSCKKAMGWCTAQRKMLLFCAKTIVKDSRNFELARLKEKKKEKHFGHLVAFWFSTFAMLFSATGCVFRLENTRR